MPGTILADARCCLRLSETKGVRTMRGVLMWLIGIPIPIIILLYLFNAV